jgi:hypothetical protein
VEEEEEEEGTQERKAEEIQAILRLCGALPLERGKRKTRGKRRNSWPTAHVTVGLSSSVVVAGYLCLRCKETARARQ